MGHSNGSSENQFGIERLKEVTGAHANKPARQIIHEIDAALRAFAGGTTQQDDVTVVVIKRLNEVNIAKE